MNMLRSSIGAAAAALLVSVTTFICNVHFKIGSYESSSVWCVLDSTGNHMCKFTNVAYNVSTDSLDFYLDDKSVIHGLKTYQDFQNIELSSVKGHNKFFADVSIDLGLREHCTTMYEKVVAMARLKSDNLMHVIHDDLLPLFVTLERLCGGQEDSWYLCSRDFRILFMDENGPGPYSFLYNIFSNHDFILRKDISSSICMKELHAGLNLESVWYQYGFVKPRGPLNEHFFNEATLLRFKHFVLHRLGITTANTGQSKRAVILRRVMSRKVLNVEKVVEYVQKVYGDSMQCIIVDVTVENTKELLEVIIDARVVIGMHGAEMILTLFTPSNATVIELFPYGVISDVVSFLKPLETIGHFSYVEWTNKDLKLSVRHPEYPPMLGGLDHLPPADKARITKSLQDPVTEVYCCNNPKFLHLMYQDTKVSDTLRDAMQQAVRLLKSHRQSYVWCYPARLRRSNCSITDTTVDLSWLPPNNVDPATVEYRIVMLLDADKIEFVTRQTSLSIERIVSSGSAWLSSTWLVNQHTSPDLFIQCVRVKQ